MIKVSQLILILVCAEIATAQVTGTLEFTDIGGNLVESYRSGDLAYVEVTDPDENSDPVSVDSLVVHLSSSTEPVAEDLTLYETGVNSGVFFGSIVLDESGAVGADGDLDVTAGDEIFVVYEDSLNDFGNVESIEDIALFGFRSISGGVITSDSTWSVAGGPYLVTGDVTVQNGVTLTVEAGVEIRFLPNRDDQQGGYDQSLSEILINGTLDAVGTETDSIRWTLQSAGPQTGEWGGIRLVSQGSGSLAYNVVLYAATGISIEYVLGVSLTHSRIDNSYTGIYIIADTIAGGGGGVEIRQNIIAGNSIGVLVYAADDLTLYDNLITNNSHYGVYLDQSSASVDSNRITNNYIGLHLVNHHGGMISTPTVINNTITNNSSYGISTQEEVSPVVNYNNLNDNGQYAFFNNSPHEIDAKLNWWGTVPTAEMDAGGNPKDISAIYDFHDDSTRGLVNYAGWLNASFPGGEPAPHGNTGTLEFTDIGGNLVESYRSGDLAYVEVTDPDENSDPVSVDSLVVHLSSSTEPVAEDLTLYETGVNSGVFFGSIVLDESGAVGADGDLDVTAGDEIFVVYEDSLNDFGNVESIEDIALFGFRSISGGVITSDSTWSVAGGPYLVTGDVTVQNGVTLTVEAGVEIRFLPNRDDQQGGYDQSLSEILINGTLDAVGTETDSIRWTLQSAGPQTGEWGGIRLVSQGSGSLAYNVVLYAATGISIEYVLGVSLTHSRIDNSYTGIYIIADTIAGGGGGVEIRQNIIAGNSIGVLVYAADDLTLYDNLITNNSHYGVYLDQSSASVDSNRITNNYIGLHLVNHHGGMISTPTVINNTITNNSSYGISTQEEVSPVVNYNNLNDNGQYAFFNNSPHEIDAKLNWWGTVPTAEMDAGGNPKDISAIYDFHDDSTRGLVNYAGWLVEPFISIDEEKSSGLPNEFDLSQNYPNPFNPVTTIAYALPKQANVRLIIYNLLGQEIARLVDNGQEAGFYSVRWNGRTSGGSLAASGIYFYRLIAGDFVETKKMMLLR